MSNNALRAIAEWPVSDPSNMDAINMREVARAALAAQPVAQAPEATEVREDGQTVPVRRWEIGIRRIVALLWGNRHEFEVDDVVEEVRKLIIQWLEAGCNPKEAAAELRLLCSAAPLPHAVGKPLSEQQIEVARSWLWKNHSVSFSPSTIRELVGIVTKETGNG